MFEEEAEPFFRRLQALEIKEELSQRAKVSRRVEHIRLTGHDECYVASPEEVLTRREEREERRGFITKFLSQLTPTEKEILIDSYVNRKKQTEIASEHNVSQSYVSKLLKKTKVRAGGENHD